MDFFSPYRKKYPAYLICKSKEPLPPHHKAPLTVHSKSSNIISKCAANSDNITSKQFQRSIFESKSNQYLIKEDIFTSSFNGTQIQSGT